MAGGRGLSGRIPGHQEVEIGLMKFYRVMGKEKYKAMARFFLEERGKNPDYFYEDKLKRGCQESFLGINMCFPPDRDGMNAPAVPPTW